MDSPKISVITPSFNQEKFIEETILSVIGQHYPNLEYIIMDGGSSDSSVEIINKYEKNITYWESKPDNGQADAINKGFEKSTGDILCWLNSDDMFMPNCLNKIATYLDTNEPQLLFGNSIHIRENSSDLRGSNVSRAKRFPISMRDYIIQPSCFWTRKTWEITGTLDETLRYTLDWDWFIRAKLKNVEFINTSEYLSIYRFHEEHKTGTGGLERKKEIASIYKKYEGERVADSYLKLHSLKGKYLAQKNLWDKFRLEKIYSFNKLFRKLHFKDSLTDFEFKAISKM